MFDVSPYLSSVRSMESKNKAGCVGRSPKASLGRPVRVPHASAPAPWPPARSCAGDVERQQPLAHLHSGDGQSEVRGGLLGNLLEREKLVRVPPVQLGPADRDGGADRDVREPVRVRSSVMSKGIIRHAAMIPEGTVMSTQNGYPACEVVPGSLAAPSSLLKKVAESRPKSSQ
jgi:hypothetical protein